MSRDAPMALALTDGPWPGARRQAANAEERRGLEQLLAEEGATQAAKWREHMEGRLGEMHERRIEQITSMAFRRHAQQGRSRAGSVAVAWLLRAHPGWSLRDALGFLAARRPETELNDEYIEALERWAVAELGRAPSLARCREELETHIRPPPGGSKLGSFGT